MYNENVCIRLKLFGEDVRNLLKANNWKESNFEDSDYILINSCSFIKSKEKEFLNKIKEIENLKKGNQKIFVFGCLPSTSFNEIKMADLKVELLHRDINEFIERFNLKDKAIPIAHITQRKLTTSGKFVFFINKFINNPSIHYRLNKDKVFHLKICEGCLGKCSYCSERFTTSLKSRKIKEVIYEFETGLKQGYKIFSLNGDDTSCFGIDNKENISDLLSKILSHKEEFFITITEFNPKGLNKKMLSLLSSKKVVFITIPVQSGSQRILETMKRPYKLSKVIKNIEKIKVLNSKIKINTHLIVGFPGETKKDFNKTLKIVKLGLFDRVKVFEYNDRVNTEASLMKNKVSEKEKKSRSQIIKKELFLKNIKTFSLSNLLMNLTEIK